MSFEWDAAKARSNLRKHGIDFADAAAVLEDDGGLTVENGREAGEQRWVTLGLDGFGRLLAVVYVWRGRTVRLISARPATPRESRQYEEGR